MPRKIALISGLTPNDIIGPVNDFLCCGPCQNVTVTFKNVHNTSLTISDLFDDPIIGQIFSWSLILVNGSTGPFFPLVVAEDETFTMTFAICGAETGGVKSISFYFNTDEHGDEDPWVFDFNCVDFSTLISTSAINFGTVAPFVTSTETFTINNTTVGEIAYVPGLGSGCPGLVAPMSGTLDPGDSITLNVDWTPVGYDETISCNLLIEYGSCFHVIVISGLSESLACEDCLCCIDIEIKTENDYIPTQSGFCDPSNFYYPASFLEKKTVIYTLNYENPIVNTTVIQFNPQLYGDDCIFSLPRPMNTRYEITYNSALMPDGSFNTMSLLGAGTNSANQKNWNAVFNPIDAANGVFKIALTFYVFEDYNNYLNAGLNDNGTKLTKSIITNPIWYDNTVASVYNTLKAINGAFYLTRPGLEVGDRPLACSFNACPRFTARFYNQGLYGGPSEFLNYDFKLFRTIGMVNNFSTIEKTQIRFKITIPSFYGTGEPVIIYNVFAENNIDNTTDWITATDLSRYRVTDIGGTGVLDNHLVRPSDISYNVTGNYWQAVMYMGTTVDPTQTYRVAAIVYDSDGTMVNTFLSEPYQVNSLPDMDCGCTLDFESTFKQYFQATSANALQPVGKERIGHELNITGDGLEFCMENWGIERGWEAALSRIDFVIYKKTDSFPTPTQTTFFGYYGGFATRIGLSSIWANNTGNLLVTQTGGVINTKINNIRVLWQNIPFTGVVVTAQTAQYMNRVSAGPLASTYVSATATNVSWINEDVWIEYTFKFNFTPFLNVPLEWNIVKAFPIRAIDFEPDNSGNYEVLTYVSVEGLDPLTGNWVSLNDVDCFGNWLQIRLTYQADREGKFIFFVEPEPFGLPVLQENDEIPSTTGMTQLSSPLVISQDTVFDPITFQAQVILDPSQLNNRMKYVFCGYISFEP